MLPFLVTTNQYPASIHPACPACSALRGEPRSTFPDRIGQIPTASDRAHFPTCTSPPAPPVGGSPLTCPTQSESLPTIPLNPLDATLMDLPANVANKRLTACPKAFRCNTYRKRGEGYSSVNQKPAKPRLGYTLFSRRGLCSKPPKVSC